MRVLVAEDHADSRLMLEASLIFLGARANHLCQTGSRGAPRDSDEPEPLGRPHRLDDARVEGPELLCRRVRRERPHAGMYLILLTSTGSARPVSRPRRRSRRLRRQALRHRGAARAGEVGVRVLTLRQQLAERVAELQAALSNVSSFKGCSRSAAIASGFAATIRTTGSRSSPTLPSGPTRSSATGFAPIARRVHLGPGAGAFPALHSSERRNRAVGHRLGRRRLLFRESASAGATAPGSTGLGEAAAATALPEKAAATAAPP